MRRWGHEVTEHLLTGIWSIHSPCPDFVFLRSSYLVVYVFSLFIGSLAVVSLKTMTCRRAGISSVSLIVESPAPRAVSGPHGALGQCF